MSSTTPPEAPSDAPAEAPPAGNPILQTVLDALAGALGDALVGSELSVDDLCVRVERDAWRAAVTFLQEHEGFDYFCFLFDSKPVRVTAQVTSPTSGRLPFPDSVAAQVEFADGCCGQLVYAAGGDSRYPKEILTIIGSGLVAEVTNFKRLTLYLARTRRKFSYASKGHAEEMEAWAGFLQGTSDHPLPFEQSRTSMLLTFAVLESIQQRCSVAVDC